MLGSCRGYRKCKKFQNHRASGHSLVSSQERNNRVAYLYYVLKSAEMKDDWLTEQYGDGGRKCGKNAIILGLLCNRALRKAQKIACCYREMVMIENKDKRVSDSEKAIS